MPGNAVSDLRIPSDYQRLFRPPGLPFLPLDTAGLVDFLEEHALLGRHWPDNGLAAAENRELFNSKEPARIAALVTRGLKTRFL
jgi:hypothetical protein